MLSLARQLIADAAPVIAPGDYSALRKLYKDAFKAGYKPADNHGISRLRHAMSTCITLCEMVSPDRNMIIATLVADLCIDGFVGLEQIESIWDADVAKMVNGLTKVSALYGKQGVVKTDNFRRLLMALAEDIRVIIIMIVDRLTLMRAINHHPDEKFVADTAFDATNFSSG